MLLLLWLLWLWRCLLWLSLWKQLIEVEWTWWLLWWCLESRARCR